MAPVDESAEPKDVIVGESLATRDVMVFVLLVSRFLGMMRGLILRL